MNFTKPYVFRDTKTARHLLTTRYKTSFQESNKTGRRRNRQIIKGRKICPKWQKTYFAPFMT